MSRKEGKLHKNERGRYELDEETYFTCGCGIELKICDTWVKTRIEHDGNDYYAVGLQGMKLEGMPAREPMRTENGIVTKCSASNRCAAVSGILESERECEQLRKEYDELRERYKNLQAAYEGQRDDFEELKKENEAHWRQLTQIMKSNPEVFEQFSGADDSEQELIDNGYLIIAR